MPTAEGQTAPDAAAHNEQWPPAAPTRCVRHAYEAAVQVGCIQPRLHIVAAAAAGAPGAAGPRGATRTRQQLLHVLLPAAVQRLHRLIAAWGGEVSRWGSVEVCYN